MRAAYANGHRCSHPVQNVAGKATGVVRVSLGGMSTAKDVQTFLNFVKRYYVNQDVKSAWPLQGQSTSIATPPQSTETPLSLPSFPRVDLPVSSSQNHKVFHIVTQSTQIPVSQKSLHEQRANNSSRLVKRSHIVYPPSPPQSPGFGSDERAQYICHMIPPPEPQVSSTEPVLRSKRSIIRKSMAGLLRRT